MEEFGPERIRVPAEEVSASEEEWGAPGTPEEEGARRALLTEEVPSDAAHSSEEEGAPSNADPTSDGGAL